MDRLKTLVITNLYPNRLEPGRGVFNRQQLARLAGLSDIRIICPLPWHRFRRVPAEDNLNGLQVIYPRYFMTPGLGRSFYARWMIQALRPVLLKVRSQWSFDVILATWVYPDGCAATYLGREMNCPVVVKAHGSDINVYTRDWLRRKLIQRGLKKASHIVCVSKSLGNKIENLGLDKNTISIVPNGCDPGLFIQRDAEECRKILGIDKGGPLILYVGNMLESKGVKDLYRAWLPVSNRCRLVLVGDGPLVTWLMREMSKNRLHEKLILTGRITHDRVPLYMNACDVFCLPSWNEGSPNVILEAMLCGKRIVATEVGGIPELVGNYDHALLFQAHDVNRLTVLLDRALFSEAVEYSRNLPPALPTWEESASQLYEILKRAKDQHQ